MAGPSEEAEHEATLADAKRRLQELEQDVAGLHDRVIDSAKAVRRSHKGVANTMENLADVGGEHASRRREMAKRSRTLAENETRDIAKLTTPSSREPHQDRDDEEPGADPA